MRRSVSIGRGRRRAALGCLIVVALVALRPRPGQAQAMLRNEPALHVNEPGGYGVPLGSATGDDAAGDDPTVRQPPSGTLAHPGFPASSIQGNDDVVDLTGNRGAALSAERVRWRPVFYLNTGFAYNDNIFISNNKVGDSITTIEPGIILAVGDFRQMIPRLGTFNHQYDVPVDEDEPQRFAYLDYHPSIYFFANHSSQNAVDESATLLGGYTFAKLSLGLSAAYQKLSIEDIDAGSRVDRDFYTLALTSLYQRNEKTSWELDFTARDHEYQAPYVSTTELVSRNYFNYAYGPKTQLSAGLALGYLGYHSVTDQIYEQALLRVTSVQFSKLNFNFSGGIEFRQSLGTFDQVDGIFDASANYTPFDSTQISLIASRAIEPSALQNENVTYTRAGITWQQRFLSRIFMTLRGTYANAAYKSVSTGQNIARSEDFAEGYIGFASDLTQYATVELSYLFRNSASNVATRTYTENIVGLDVRLTY